MWVLIFKSLQLDDYILLEKTEKYLFANTMIVTENWKGRLIRGSAYTRVRTVVRFTSFSRYLRGYHMNYEDHCFGLFMSFSAFINFQING